MQRVRLCGGFFWFLWSCPDGCLGGEVIARDLSLGLIVVLVTFRAVEVISRSRSTIWAGYNLDAGGCNDHLIWIQTGSGGYSDLGIRNKLILV